MLSPNGQSVKYERTLRYGKFTELASKNLLHNIKQAEAYGHGQIYMVIVNGNSPAQDRMGELNFQDEDGTCIIILCYVQIQFINGHDNFVLISNDTLDNIQTATNYHSSMSRHVGIILLRNAEQIPISL